jgi:hypothetical protein
LVAEARDHSETLILPTSPSDTSSDASDDAFDMSDDVSDPDGIVRSGGGTAWRRRGVSTGDGRCDEPVDENEARVTRAVVVVVDVAVELPSSVEEASSAKVSLAAASPSCAAGEASRPWWCSW